MRTQVILPTLHAGQVRAFNTQDPATARRARFKAIRCGRRWGKTELGKCIAGNAAIKRKYVGWFAPEYKILSEAYNEIVEMLAPVVKSSSKTEGVIRTTTGGRIDFWTLENERAGRSRRYHEILIDEGAFTKPNMLGIWQKSIRPTLLDYKGRATVLSNTNGQDTENFFWQLCNQPEHGFHEYHAPTHDNPYLPADELVKLQAENHPQVYQQEYLAEFVDWSGLAFFSRDSLLVDGLPIEQPVGVDAVFAIVDTAVKTGTDNDGTAVTYYATSQHGHHPLMILDWDVVQIEGASLETWLPNVFMRLEELAAQCAARAGSVGVWIEDAQSGMVLLQQAANRGWAAHAIESKLTTLGKDGRALSVSGYVYRGMVKFTRYAFEKVVTYKGATRNHLLTQVTGFRLGDKKAATRADDLLDTFTYGVALALGDGGGF